MYQPSATNFIGRDPMQWWIGQVTDPVKGEWGDALEKTRDADPDKKDIYSHQFAESSSITYYFIR